MAAALAADIVALVIAALCAEGESVIMEVVDNELHVRTYRASVRRAQERLRHLRPTDGSRLSDELIADRRKEAENE